VRGDPLQLYEQLRPATVGCFNLGDLAGVPVDTILRGGSQLWLVDWQAGRLEHLLANEVVRERGDGCTCLACETDVAGEDVCASFVRRSMLRAQTCGAYLQTRGRCACAHFLPGRRVRVVLGDDGLGRAAGFATRLEEVGATAATPAAALQAALQVCHRSAHMRVTLPIADGALNFAISVFAPVRLLEQPFAYFDQMMTRRFGAWGQDAAPPLSKLIRELQTSLFEIQLKAHVRELVRQLRPGSGRLYFATVPVEASTSGAWGLERGVSAAFAVLSRHFDFDFDAFPPEAFLRRDPHDRSLVLQAVVLSPRSTTDPGG
jgi:hypothetical protein